MKTNESNKLISDFMGIHEDARPMYFAYHTSWDWLMPVVEKIENTLDKDGYGYNFRIENTFCVILSANNGDILLEAEGIFKLEATYKAVVEFIKWYNVQNTEKKV